MQSSSKSRMHCSKFASGDDSDEAVQDVEPCNHVTTPCDLSNMQFCSFIAPDLKQGDSSKCFGCNLTANESARWRSKVVLHCTLVDDCPMWIHERCLKTLTLGGRTSSKVQCRYHTEIYDRHQHPEECHSCNSTFEFCESGEKLVLFLDNLFQR